MKKLKIHRLFAECVSDPRTGECTYSLSSLLTSALSNVLFLCGSKNSFFSQVHSTQEVKKKFADFLHINNGKFPVTKTVDDVFKKINYNELNEVLFGLFENTRLSKLFFEHEELIPDGEYHIALDGEKIHTYAPESDHDCESCPYCLKRTRNGTTWYCHVIIVASLVCPGGFKLPLYVYPIHAESIKGKESGSDDEHKQECELSAFKEIIPKLRERFPKLKMCLLLDSLYANGPSIALAEEHNFSCAIVRKKGSMSSVGKDCDGLLNLSDYEQSHSVEQKITTPNGMRTHRKTIHFNDIEYQDRKINILRFYESFLTPKGKKKKVYWEWIVSWKITKRNAMRSSSRGRLRWHEEDLFNTAENRGFNIEHDYSRQSNSQIVWTVLIMIAIFIMECFTHTRSMIKKRDSISIRDFMKDLFYQLKHLTKKVIFAAPVLLKRIQFRYCFDTGPP